MFHPKKKRQLFCRKKNCILVCVAKSNGGTKLVPSLDNIGYSVTGQNEAQCTAIASRSKPVNTDSIQSSEICPNDATGVLIWFDVTYSNNNRVPLLEENGELDIGIADLLPLNSIPSSTSNDVLEKTQSVSSASALLPGTRGANAYDHKNDTVDQIVNNINNAIAEKAANIVDNANKKQQFIDCSGTKLKGKMVLEYLPPDAKPLEWKHDHDSLHITVGTNSLGKNLRPIKLVEENWEPPKKKYRRLLKLIIIQRVITLQD